MCVNAFRRGLSGGIRAEICLSFDLRLLTHTTQRPNRGIYLKRSPCFTASLLSLCPGRFFLTRKNIFFRITSLSFSENLWIRLGTRTEAAAKWWKWFWNVCFFCVLWKIVWDNGFPHAYEVCNWLFCISLTSFFFPLTPFIMSGVFSWEISALSELSVPRIYGDTVK